MRLAILMPGWSPEDAEFWDIDINDDSHWRGFSAYLKHYLEELPESCPFRKKQNALKIILIKRNQDE